MSCRMFLFPLALMIIVVASGSTLVPCYRFTFPSIFQNMNIISTTEGSSITLPFKLDTGPCIGGWNRTIYTYVLYPPSKNNLRQIFCAVTFGQRGCKSLNKDKCACLEGTFGDIGANFSKAVSKADSGSWLWRTGDGLTMEIHFDIEDRPTPDSTALVTSSTSQGNRREQKAITEVTRNNDTQSGYALQEISQTTPDIVQIKVGKRVDASSPEFNSMKTGLITGSVNIVIAIAIVLVVFLCRRRRAREMKARCTVNFTPVLEGDDDVLTWAQRRDDPYDVGRSTSYVSFGGTMTWSNENIPQVHRNEGYLATSPSDQSFCPMVHP